MITNFEAITYELTDAELEVLPLIVSGFRKHTKSNPIKGPVIVKKLNEHHTTRHIRFTEARLRKFVNYIRTNSLLPLIATSEGYYVCEDRHVLESQIQSLYQRAASIKACADGLFHFLPPTL